MGLRGNVLNRHRRKRPCGHPGRPVTYLPAVLLTALKHIWFATDQMCSKKLKAALPLWLPFYHTAYEPLSPELKSQLLSMSPATIDRLLKPVRAKSGRKGLCGTHPGSLLKNQIPIRTHYWDITQPGFIEADTVAHCGDCLAGSFVWSLTLTDILTTWTEIRATWNKGASGVCDQIRSVESRLPFALQGFDCDNGYEQTSTHDNYPDTAGNPEREVNCSKNRGAA